MRDRRNCRGAKLVVPLNPRALSKFVHAGKIPPELGGLCSLQKLFLSRNRLDGVVSFPIPSSEWFPRSKLSRSCKGALSIAAGVAFAVVFPLCRANGETQPEMRAVFRAEGARCFVSHEWFSENSGTFGRGKIVFW